MSTIKKRIERLEKATKVETAAASEAPVQKPLWTCEYCFRPFYGEKLPDDWDFVWQSAVCPDCKVKVAADGGYFVVPGGKYATGPDPRATRHSWPGIKFAGPLPIEDPLNQEAGGKKLCGLCGYKAARKGDWRCTRHIPQPSYEEYEGMTFYPCPASNRGCPGFERKPIVTTSIQPKPERLAVPPGMIFLYINRVTIAVLLRGGDVDKGSIWMGFAFCHSGNPKKGLKPDRFCKATGRNEAMKSLYDDPLIAPYLYDPIRTAKEVTRAILGHDLARVSTYGALLPHNLYKRVPGWTKAIVKRFDRWEKMALLVRPRGGHKKLDLMPGKIMRPGEVHLPDLSPEVDALISKAALKMDRLSHPSLLIPGPIGRIISDILRMPL